MTEKHKILGIHITDRVQHASRIQNVLTEFGYGIRTRLGLHETADRFSSPNGLLILEFVGSDEDQEKMLNQLDDIEGIEVQTMIFDHP